MLPQSSLIGFVPTSDADRARAFYVDLLGLQFLEDDGFALVLRSDSSMVRIVKMKAFTAAPFTILGWEVPDASAAVRDLTAAGVVFARYPFLQQDELGVWTSPSGNKVAWFQDPDGNVLSLSQH